jgi:hypothetical protein
MELDFNDLSVIEVPVKVAGRNYVLREATEEAACRWRNHMLRATRIGQDGRPTGIGDLADSEPLLVSLCLFEAKEDGTAGAPVKLAAVKGWPSRVVGRLFAKAKQISELEEKEDRAALEQRLRDITDKLAALEEDPSKNGRDTTPASSG